MSESMQNSSIQNISTSDVNGDDKFRFFQATGAMMGWEGRQGLSH